MILLLTGNLPFPQNGSCEGLGQWQLDMLTDLNRTQNERYRILEG